jgi:hypothetical protein
MIQKVAFLYRDGANYKYPFTAEVKTKTQLNVGDEIDYKVDLGISQSTFHSKVVKENPDEEIDHTFLTVEEILPEHEDVQHSFVN